MTNQNHVAYAALLGLFKVRILTPAGTTGFLPPYLLKPTGLQ
jgi:hypothetical protein